MRKANGFVKGQSTYSCRCCKRLTRQTGRGDNDMVNLCAPCYDLAGEENHISDNGELYDSPQQVLSLIEEVAAHGDASSWIEIQEFALKALEKL